MSFSCSPTEHLNFVRFSALCVGQGSPEKISPVLYTHIYYVCVCVCVCMYIYIYIYIYRERERERERFAIFVIGLCSGGYGSQEGSWSVVYKLENE